MAKKAKKAKSPKLSKTVAKFLKPKKAKKAKKAKRKGPKLTPAPVVVPKTVYKDREVDIVRPAVATDSFYQEGQDQVIVKFKDDGSEVTAFRADVVTG